MALIIRQSKYEHLSPLANPEPDARGIDQPLRTLGFETTLAGDPDARKLTRAVRNFTEDAAGADVAPVYCAGHGVEAAGENRLVPADAGLAAIENADRMPLPVTGVLGELGRADPRAQSCRLGRCAGPLCRCAGRPCLRDRRRNPAEGGHRRVPQRS